MNFLGLLSKNLSLVVVVLIILGSLVLSVMYNVDLSREGFADSSSGMDRGAGASDYYDWGSLNSLFDSSLDHSGSGHSSNNGNGNNKNKCKPKKRCTIEDLDREEKLRLCHSCDITLNKDIDKYVLKSSIPPCPDMSKYALKSELQPAAKPMYIYQGGSGGGTTGYNDNLSEESVMNKYNKYKKYWENKLKKEDSCNNGLEAACGEGFNDYVSVAEMPMAMPHGLTTENFYCDFEKMSDGPTDKGPIAVKSVPNAVNYGQKGELSWWTEKTAPNNYEV